MSFRALSIIVIASIPWPGARADEVLYRYEGDVLLSELPDDWPGNPCDEECTAFIEDGHFVLFWAEPGDRAGYLHWINQRPDPPPPSLWVEWRFRSNHPFGWILLSCDGVFKVQYDRTNDLVHMYGDAAISESGGRVVSGLNIDEFHTYRFESLDGMYSRVAVDGLVFMVDWDNNSTGSSGVQLIGHGGCNGDNIPNKKQEWDYVRYGTISLGERIIASDPPGGYLDPGVYSNLDRFTVTFESANYVYIDDVTVEVSGGIAPQVIQTRRRETDDVDTVEIVLDRPLPTGQRTRFIFNDGQATNVVSYCLGLGPICGDGCCNVDESCTTCAQDCQECGDGCCTADEDTCSCPQDCSSNCGDGCCNAQEDCLTCLQDCQECGDGCCAATESACSCPADCPATCGDGCCSAGETFDDCPIECEQIPTLSHWGLTILTLLTLTAGTVILSGKASRSGPQTRRRAYRWAFRQLSRYSMAALCRVEPGTRGRPPSYAAGGRGGSDGFRERDKCSSKN